MIRFNLHSTSFAFVCSHFAAGQSQVKERNDDYTEIARNLSSPFARSLHSHDYVIWCGDFNYRIDMERDTVKETIFEGDWPSMLEFDQLKANQNRGLVFQDYIEGEINFPPTYKYDLFSDDYDTSEKCRIPAWTDRVLLRRRKFGDIGPDWSPCKVVFYGRAELKQSDHRPVIATFDVDALRVDEDAREDVISDVIRRVGPQDGTVEIQVIPEMGPSVADDGFINTFKTEMNMCGEIAVMRRTQEGKVCITFKEGFGALAAFKYHGKEINGRTLQVRPLNTQWEVITRKELALFSDTSLPLIPTLTSAPSFDYASTLAAIKLSSNDPFNDENERQKDPPRRPAPPSRPQPVENGAPVVAAAQPPTTLALTNPLTTSTRTINESPESKPPSGLAPVLKKSPPANAPFVKDDERKLPPVPPRKIPPVPARSQGLSQTAFPPVPSRNNTPPVPPRA
ncbi:hypothetical protein QYM36_003676 [Artemia franciscana]|uniref:Uncharacterized protein n=2 Tax=Artemia franciscana TaxID=6661 RepID=A0AA88LE66_ARTSF|nr:hypothetical protein QYM36_003676 [Artemia franciscana]